MIYSTIKSLLKDIHLLSMIDDCEYSKLSKWHSGDLLYFVFPNVDLFVINGMFSYIPTECLFVRNFYQYDKNM